MSNNNQQQPPNIPNNPFDGKAIVKNLFDTHVTLGMHGVVFNETCSVLEDKVVEMYNNLGITEMDRVLIYPLYEERSGDLTAIKCYAYFDTAMQGAKNITRIGGNRSRNNGGNNVKDGKISIFTLAPGLGSKGKYNISDLFKENLFPVAADISNNELHIQEAEDPSIAVLELDFMAVLALCLNIGDDDPYNFTIIDVIPTNRRRNGNFEDANMIVMKYIDNSKMTRRKKGRSGRRIDYRRLEQNTIDSINARRRRR